MDVQYLLNSIPNLSPEEYAGLKSLMNGLPEEQQQQFLMFYRSDRKDPQTVLILAVVGFFGFAGIHRFVLGQIGMGILYFFTGGLCLIGTIVDLVNHKTLANEYNRGAAERALQMTRMSSR
ncbi:MAG: TM2 domain-containing protein [Mucilaginibacter polytrichastri]|nr:TM2 domain-containing protein [Mucilaginibacter polytrichastri]